jgi:hypothetical protein
MYHYDATFKTLKTSPLPEKEVHIIINIGCDIPELVVDLCERIADYHRMTFTGAVCQNPD